MAFSNRTYTAKSFVLCPLRRILFGGPNQAECDGWNIITDGRMTNGHKRFVGNPEKISLGTLKLSLENNIKMDIKEAWCKDVDWLLVNMVLSLWIP
jgi:hypothetical protein